MSYASDYKREESSGRIEPGDYRVAIVEVEDTTSRAGNPMIVISLRPSGSTITIKHYLVKNEYFNRNMTSFFDSFDIPEGNFNFAEWQGAKGAACLVNDENGYLKVRYFIRKDKAAELPPYTGNVPERQTVTEFKDADIEDDDDLPF